jgi:hypothetical protein
MVAGGSGPRRGARGGPSLSGDFRLHTVVGLVVKQRGVAGKLGEIRSALLSVRDKLSTVRCPPRQLEEGDGDDGMCWRLRRPACWSHSRG